MKRLGDPFYNRLGVRGLPYGFGTLKTLSYIYKVLRPNPSIGYDPSNLIGFWPQNESVGAVSYDHSAEGNDGAYTDVTLGQPGVPGMGITGAGYGGLTSVNNIYSVALAAAFNGDEGTLLLWAKVSAAGVWEDAATRRMMHTNVDDNNYCLIEKRNIDDTIRFLYVAGGVVKSFSMEVRPSLDYVCHTLTWYAGDDEAKAFSGGIQNIATLDTLGVWAGDLHVNRNAIGATNAAAANSWSGDLGPALLYKKALTLSQIAYLSNRNPMPAVVIDLDDGLTSVYTIAYPLMAARGIKGTAYIVSSTIDTGGNLTVAQLQELYAAGWDIGNHTVTHTDLTTLNLAAQTAELEGGRVALDGWGLIRASSHVAYPGGAENADTQTAMVNLGMLTGRKVVNKRMNRIVDPHYKLPAKNITVLADIIAETQAALDGGQIFVYYAHDIDGGVDLSAADFGTWLDWLVANNVETLTISELYSRMPQ